MRWLKVIFDPLLLFVLTLCGVLGRGGGVDRPPPPYTCGEIYREMKKKRVMKSYRVEEWPRRELSTHLSQLRGRIIGDVRRTNGLGFRVDSLCGHQVVLVIIVAAPDVHGQQVGSCIWRGSGRSGAEPFRNEIEWLLVGYFYSSSEALSLGRFLPSPSASPLT